MTRLTQKVKREEMIQGFAAVVVVGLCPIDKYTPPAAAHTGHDATHSVAGVAPGRRGMLSWRAAERFLARTEGNAAGGNLTGLPFLVRRA